ncbi:MAG: metallophosphoesterase family protein [Candidatus Heimdallarchaeota archaeon]
MATRPMRIMLVADLHANLPAYVAVHEEITSRYGKNIDHVICLGDIVGYGPWPNELCKIAEGFALNVIGNHDVACAAGNAQGFNRAAKKAVLWTFDELSTRNKTFLSILAKNEYLEIEEHGVKFYLTHASPKDYLSDYIYPEDSTERKDELLGMIGVNHVMMVGHTHIPFLYQSEKTGKVIFNPGSVGQPRDNDPRASVGIVEISTDSELNFEWIRVKYDIREVAREIQRVGLPIRLAERLFFGQ